MSSLVANTVVISSAESLVPVIVPAVVDNKSLMAHIAIEIVANTDPQMPWPSQMQSPVLKALWLPAVEQRSPCSLAVHP